VFQVEDFVVPLSGCRRFQRNIKVTPSCCIIMSMTYIQSPHMIPSPMTYASTGNRVVFVEDTG
jgi:hypothetical protein